MTPAQQPTTTGEQTQLPVVQRLQQLLDSAGSALSEATLIRFDWRTMLLILICAVLFGVNVMLQTSGSSVQQWNTFVRGDSSAQRIIGNSRFIRFDEWGMATPLTLSQVHHDFQPRNPALGAGASALLMSLPVRTFPSVVRPQLLGYFIFGVERAFSFTWNYKVYGLFLSVFLLLMLLTHNQFWLSVSGALWLSYSSFVQWWFSTPEPEMIMAACLCCVFFIYLCYARRRWVIALSALALAVYALTFALFFYPPHQIPLAYFMLFLVVGYIWQRHNPQLLRIALPLKISALTIVLAFLCFALLSFLEQARETIGVMTQTVYPGNRISTGGEVSLARFFGGFLDFTFNEKHYPAQWENVCEASNFILLFPAVVVAMIVARWRKQRIDRVQLMLVVFLLFLSAWMLVGYPSVLATITLLDRVKENRAFIGIGMASIVLVILHLSQATPESTKSTDAGAPQPAGREKHKRSAKSSSKTPAKSLLGSLHLTPLNLGLTALSLVVLYVYGQYASSLTASFFRGSQILFAALFFAVLVHCILVRQHRIFCWLIVPFVLINNFMINPLMFGLSPIENKDMMRAVSQIRERDPGARWVYYGSNIVANYFIAAGLNIINGTKFAPDLELMRIIDSSQAAVPVYNRFAQIRFMPNTKATANNQVQCVLDNYDGYSVFINPCAPQLTTLGVKYFALAMLPTTQDLACIEPVYDKPIQGLWLFRRRTDSRSAGDSVMHGVQFVDRPNRFGVGNVRIVDNETHDGFVVTGVAYNAELNDLAGGVVADVNGRLIRGQYGLYNPGVSDKRYSASAFRIDLPYAQLGRGHTEFKLHIISKDSATYSTSGQRFGVDIDG